MRAAVVKKAGLLRPATRRRACRALHSRLADQRSLGAPPAACWLKRAAPEHEARRRTRAARVASAVSPLGAVALKAVAGAAALGNGWARLRHAARATVRW